MAEIKMETETAEATVTSGNPNPGDNQPQQGLQTPFLFEGEAQEVPSSVSGSKVDSTTDGTSSSTEQQGSNNGKSSISVYFADWVPAAGDSFDLDNRVNEFMPTVVGGNRQRYFHVQRGNRKLRPGLGSDPIECPPSKFKSKSKKRKTSPMELLADKETLSKKFKITPDKPASAILHEINSNLTYNYQECPPPEGGKAIPSFVCSVVFPPENGREYTGEGRSKKLAKTNVAEQILDSLGVIIPKIEPDGSSRTSDSSNLPASALDDPMNPSTIGSFDGSFHNIGNLQEPAFGEIDFASDDIMNMNFSSPERPLLSQPMVDSHVFRRLRNIPNFEENICLVLNTIISPNSVEYEYLGEEGPPHDKKFTVKVRLNMQEYVGQGGSKKKAKANAAKQAVTTLLGENYYKLVVENSQQLPLKNSNAKSNLLINQKKVKTPKEQNISTVSDSEKNLDAVDMDEDDDDDWGEYDLNFSDYISNSVKEKYEELMANDATYSSYKVLAGVVMSTSSPLLYNSTVIALSTGTKCIEGDFLSDQGLAVNDCHAEILSNRCLREFLYQQIEQYQNATSEKEKFECILEANDCSGSPFKLKLKEGVKFHLYISTSPCGDARIFSPKGIEIDEDTQPSPPNLENLEDSHPKKMNRGVLRSKIEAGEGTIPAGNLYTGPQTWDSIISGNALFTMSCSDKVCRWNVLGLQGALLHNFLGPVYYSSITLGSLHHPVHFRRAVYGRVEALNSRLEMPFTVNKPKLLMISREEKRKVKKSPNHAMCWTANWSTPEILAASKGRCDTGGVASRLTKRQLMARFVRLYSSYTGQVINNPHLTYEEAKAFAAKYQEAKEVFVNFFKESNFGPWIGKPVEQDAFTLQK